MKKIINLFLGMVLRLRYSICFSGLDQINSDGRPILFLPNHQALIDPLIVMNGLYNRFAPRPLADENQLDHPLARPVVRALDMVVIPAAGRLNPPSPFVRFADFVAIFGYRTAVFNLEAI